MKIGPAGRVKKARNFDERTIQSENLTASSMACKITSERISGPRAAAYRAAQGTP
jgi:hypothetical protein